jgi:hypothetical protein
MSAPEEMKNALASAVNAPLATRWRTGWASRPKVRSGVMEMATKSSPMRAAPAPALARK